MDLILIVLIVGAITVLNLHLAEQRGRSKVGWALGAVFFGIFSTLLLLILGTTQEKKDSDMQRAFQTSQNFSHNK